MDKSKSAVFIILIFLFTGFVLISFLSFMFKKQPKLISRKIKIGAMILTLTTVMTTNSFSQKTCYKRAADPDNEIVFFNKYLKEGGLKIDLGIETKINGELRNRMADKYSFALINASGDNVYTGMLIAKDGKFDDLREGFYINLYGAQAGEYNLSIFEGLEKTTPLKSFMISIKGEPKPEILCYW